MAYKDRLKQLNQGYQKSKAQASGSTELPKGTYTFEFKKAMYVPESKAPFAKGEPEVKLSLQVTTGPMKGAWGNMNIFIAQPKKNLGDGKEIPDGLTQLKTLLEGMGVAMSQLSEKALKKALRELIGMKCQGYCTGKYNNVLFNRALEVEDEEVTDEDFEEEEYEDEDDEDDEFED